MRRGQLAAAAITAAALVLAPATALAAPGTSAAAPGSALWTATHDSGTAHSIAADPSQGLVFTAGNSLAAYNASTGAKVWEADGTYFQHSQSPGGGGSSLEVLPAAPAQAVAVGPAGNTVYVVRTYHHKGAGGRAWDYSTAAFSATTGVREWLSLYNGPANLVDVPVAITVSSKGDVYVTGTSPDATSGDCAYATVAYGSSGKQLWAARYNGPRSGSLAAALTTSPDGTKVFVTGTTVGTYPEDANYATIAYAAASGKVLWTKSYNDPKNGADHPGAIAVSPDGTKVFVAGATQQGNEMLTTVAYAAATGAQLWTKTAGRVYDQEGDFTVTLAASPAAGGVVVASGTSPRPFAIDSVAYASGTGAQKWTATDSTGNPLLQGAALSSDGATLYLVADDTDASSATTIAVSTATGTQAWSSVIPVTGSTTTGGIGAAVIGGDVDTLAQNWVPVDNPDGFTLVGYQG